MNEELKRELEKQVAEGTITAAEAADIEIGAIDWPDVREEQRIYNETMLENCSGDLK